VCASSCTTDASCNSSTYCSGGACVSKRSRGAACTANNECSSGHCADGVCCDTACDGKCEACTTGLKGSGETGVCGAIADGTDPADECTGDTCVSGTLTVQVCDGSRACRGKSSSCGSFGCNTTGDACLKSCTTADDCGPDYYCTEAKDCARRKNAGLACTTRNECKSGLFCADGVCCDQACNGQCQACNEKGSEGSCVAVLGAPRGARTACKGDGSACNGTCDGINGGACTFPSASLACGDGCKDSKLSVCDGAGTCLSPTACAGNLTCDGTKACRTACTEDAHCNTGFRCLDGKCAPKPTAVCSEDGLSSVAAESADGTPRPCAPYRCGPSGACLDSCSSSSDCAPGNVCDTSTTPAHCNPVAGAVEDGGGCAMGSSSSSTGGLALALIALFGAARRRRLAQR
jgi:MYXO-CTERM domain-containing protein